MKKSKTNNKTTDKNKNKKVALLVVKVALLVVKVALLVVQVALTVCLPVAVALLAIKVALLAKAKRVKPNTKNNIKTTTNK